MGEAVLDRLPEAVFVLRRAVVTLANERARTLLGWDATAVGRHIDDVASFVDDAGWPVTFPEEPPSVGHRYAEHIVHLLTGDGSRPVAMTGRWSQGELFVTLRGAARRDAAVRMQGEVVATVAHEIRSPLSSVKGFTRTLLSRWDRFSDEQKHAMLETIDADADRVTRLLTDLLEVSRIDAGRVKLYRSEVDVAALVRVVADKARMRISAPDIEVAMEQPVGSISADRDKLEQVLANLVDNAIQHAPGSPVMLTVAPAGDDVRISVSDRGPGVDIVTAPRLFRKFGRGRSDHRAGTGLGLFLVKGLVEAHGGRTWFDPDVTDGATVHVQLPTGPP